MTVTVAYIQQHRGTYVAPCGFSAHEGFRFQGKEVRLFEEGQLADLPLTPETLVHGWVRVVEQALRQLGKPIPSPLDYPEALRAYLGREVRQTTLGEMHTAWHEDKPVFIKPVVHKVFTGHTIERFSHLGETVDLPRDTLVWESSIVDFETEYRCFVLDNQLVGIKHYLGNAWILPNRSTVRQMIKDYADTAPAAYGLDVGVVDGRTLLVEVNDCFSLGNYCFNSDIYCEMLEARWMELMA